MAKGAASKPLADQGVYYLERELYALVQSRADTLDVLRATALGGLWYWDLEQPDNGWFSPEYKAALGYAEHEVPDSALWWRDTIFPEDRQASIDGYMAHRTRPNTPFNQVARHHHKNGSTVWLRSRGVIIRSKDGAPSRMLGAATDITQLKLAEQRFIRQAEALEQANFRMVALATNLERERSISCEQREELERMTQDLERFAVLTSHDFSEPLRKISTLGDLLMRTARSKLTHQEASVVDRMCHSASALQLLVDDAHDYTKTGAERYEMGPIDLAELVEYVLRELKAELAESNAKVEVGPLNVLDGDSHQIQLLMHNLIDNAIKFRTPNTPARIRIASEDHNGTCLLRVQDEGIGFEQDQAELIFMLFRRLHGRTSSYPGTGVGLAICKRVVERHSGRIWAVSAPDQGAHFYVQLPFRHDIEE